MIPAEISAGLALLHPRDRSWLLSRFQGADRQRVEAILFEAERASTPTLLAAAKDSAQAAWAGRQAASQPSQDEVLLSKVAADEIVPLLAQLPPACVGILFHFKVWPWANDAMPRLSLAQRSAAQTRSGAPTGAGVTRLGAWVVAELAEAIRRQRSAAQPSARRFETLLDPAS